MPRDAFQIRDAVPADAPAILRIYGPEVETGIATFEEVAPSEAEMAHRMKKVLESGLPYLVAEREGVVLGYAYAAPFHARPAYRFTVENTVYVDPAAQGQGVGAALLRQIIARCEAAGCRQMIALIVADNRNSVALHEKLGFRPLGTAQSVGFKFGRWIDIAYMQRALGTGDTTLPEQPVAH